MYEWLLRADLVIADLSTANLNATFELGVRYGLKRRATIILAEQGFKNPFDVSHIIIRRYEHLQRDQSCISAQRSRETVSRAGAACRGDRRLRHRTACAGGSHATL